MSDNSKNQKPRILFVDDRPVDRERAVSALGGEEYEVRQADSVGSVREFPEDKPFDLVVAACHNDSEPGSVIVESISRNSPDSSAILLMEPNAVERDAKAIQAGTIDYLACPFSADQLRGAVRRALKLRKVKQELTILRQTVAMSWGFDNIVGISEPIVQLKESAQRLAPTDITLLIVGAPGTGKKLLARVIHHHSKRRHAPFVAIDCSTAPQALLAADMFGDDASRVLLREERQMTQFERAHGGTIFLNNVDRLPAALQPGLVRFLQNFEAPGTDFTDPKKVDVRVIAATDKDLSGLVSECKFDKDLFHRLSVIPLPMPTLSKRADDIEILTEYFLRRMSGDLRQKQLSISRAAVDKLLRHSWPGNVRELENCLRRAAALCHDKRLETEDISFIPCGHGSAVGEDKTSPGSVNRNGLLDDSQRSIIRKALNDNNWNFTQTAQELGIGRTTLWRKVKKYRLEKEASFDES